jgi:transcriptional regulator with XRE-family HTH domain
MKRNEQDPSAESLALVLIRHLRNLEQGEVARLAGMSPSQLSDYERSERPVPREVLERVAQVADLPVTMLDALVWILRSFRAAANARSREGRALADSIATELIALVREAQDLIAEVSRQNDAPFTEADPEE